MKKNFLGTKEQGDKTIAWKIHDASTDIHVLDQFRKKDLHAKRNDEDERRTNFQKEMKLEMFVQ